MKKFQTSIIQVIGIYRQQIYLLVIAGHWGELLPFYIDRMNFAFNAKVTGLKHDIKYYFNKNIYTNPSGMFFKDDFDFVLKTFNKENILWGQDYPYGINDKSVKTFLEEFDIDEETKEMIAYKNTEKLFKIKKKGI